MKNNEYFYKMNKIIIGTVFFLFMSCGEKKSETSQKEIISISENDISITTSEEKIPSIDFETLQPLLNKYNDTTYVVNFWATWCKPCIKELPAFEKLNTDYGQKKVKVLLVSLDFPKQLKSQVIPFIEKLNITSQVVLLNDPDANSWIPKVDTSWTGAIPATLIYNALSRKFYERSFTYNELENELISILNN